MKLSDISASGFFITPWPTLIAGLKADSAMQESPRCAAKCGDFRDCSRERVQGEHTCVHGMSYFCFEVSSETIVIYGVRGDRSAVSSSFHNKAWFKGRNLTIAEARAWVAKAEGVRVAAEKEVLRRQALVFDILHDPMRLAKQVNTIANKIVQQRYPGGSFDDQIERASMELKTLVRASSMLTESFDFLTIYMNPSAASFGAMKSANLHGLTRKIVSIMGVDDDGLTEKAKRIRLSGTCYKNVFVYESFKLIPFAIISNALKYSPSGTVDVRVDDQVGGGVEMVVSSVGPLIEDYEREKIFLKNFRGRHAATFEGRGVGLYLAKVVADANKAELGVTSTLNSGGSQKPPMATNRFRVVVR